MSLDSLPECWASATITAASLQFERHSLSAIGSRARHVAAVSKLGTPRIAAKLLATLSLLGSTPMTTTEVLDAQELDGAVGRDALLARLRKLEAAGMVASARKGRGFVWAVTGRGVLELALAAKVQS